MPLDLYCVMGHPISHSRSPWIHARFAELTGQTLVYDKRDIAPPDFARSVHAFVQAGGRGCNITVPFKFEAAALATHTTKRAQLAQACNVLTFAHGHIRADNTDGIGLVNDIERNFCLPLANLRLLLLGAGGAAAGVLGPLIGAHPQHITVANRTLAKAAHLVARHQAWAALHKTELLAHDLHGLEASFDVIINATASSLNGADVPVGAQVLQPGALAYDMMYGAGAQAFLDWAAQHQAQPRDGLGMLVEQAAEAFLIWRGVRPPANLVLAELRQALGR